MTIILLYLRKYRITKVVIFSENRPEWIFALVCRMEKGATVVPVDVFSSHEDVAYILKDCDPEVVFCSAEKYEFIRAGRYRMQAGILKSLYLKNLHLQRIRNLQRIQ